MYEDNNNLGYTGSTNMNNTNAGSSAYSGGYSSYEISSGKPKEQQKKKSAGFFKKALICTALGLIFGGFGALGFFAVNLATGTLATGTNEVAQTQEKITTTTTAPETKDVAVKEDDKEVANTLESAEVTVEAMDVTDVVNEVMPSVVSIVNKSTQEAMTFFGQVQEYEAESSGSGIIVGESDSEILIATNNHVADAADTLSIQFIDGTTAEAKLKGADSDVDLAVVAVSLEDIEQDTMDAIRVATLGDSSALQVGEPAIAIGNALGYGQSVTTGVISALDREITIDDITRKLIQTDAAINPGNSGGALLNMNGEVIGINSAKFSSSMVEGMGYAIPVSDARPIIDELMNRAIREKVSFGEESYLGISGVDVTEDVAQTYSMPIGIYVAQALEGTAAESAGLKKGDVITKFDGQKVTSMADLQDVLSYYPAGTTIDIVIQRMDGDEYKEQTVSVTLGSKAEQQ